MVSLTAWYQANYWAVKMILPNWFDHLEESSSYKGVQFKKLCLPVKASCPPAENVNETPGCFKLLFNYN